MKDIYDFAYPSRSVVLQPRRNRPVLLDGDGADRDTLKIFRQFAAQGNVPRDAWEAANGR